MSVFVADQNWKYIGITFTIAETSALHVEGETFVITVT